LNRNSWLEFDASLKGLKVSRHIHNDHMIFFDIEHLYTFMKRLQVHNTDRKFGAKLIKSHSIQSAILLDVQQGIAKAQSLVIYREKNGKKREELFFDMLVYNKNRCLRLPWSTKVGEKR
jgi:hypothetical protein